MSGVMESPGEWVYGELTPFYNIHAFSQRLLQNMHIATCRYFLPSLTFGNDFVHAADAQVIEVEIQGRGWGTALITGPG